MDPTKDNSLDITAGYPYSDSNDTITLSASDLNDYNTVLGGGYSYSNASVTIGNPFSFANPGAVSGTINTGAGAYGSPWATTASVHTPKLKLDGDDADIEINGKSLLKTLEALEERLNILTPNTKLEAEWEDLKTLGEQYRKLEQHIKDKQATWDKLKAMPPPVID